MGRNTPAPQQIVRLNGNVLASTTSSAGELLYDTDRNTVVAMDGVKAGGHELLREDRKIVSASSALLVNQGASADFSGDITIELDHSLLGQQWGVYKEGSPPQSQLEIAEQIAGLPVGALVNYSVEVIGPVEIVSGVTIERHPTEPGSVLSWYDIGTSSNVNLLVFDAVKRRADLAWNPSDSLTDSPLPNLQSPNANGTWYIDGTGSAVSQDTASELTLEQFNTIWPKNVLDPNTAKYNCDQWALLGISNYPCLQYVRSILTTDGKQANVPNIQQLMRIFSCAEALDARDTSLSSYPSFALTGWFNNSWAWASSEFNSNFERLVNYYGRCYYDFKTRKGVAIPVLEL